MHTGTQHQEGRPDNWFKRHKKLVIILSIVGVLIIAGGVTLSLYLLNNRDNTQEVTPQPEPEPEPEPIKYYSPLTGLEVKDEAATKQAVTGVMIENSPEARPQSGMKNSGIIYEATAEGGITRFLVLYQQEKPKLIGPVRSVRIYYVDWLAPFNASVAHVGGSYDALLEVRNGKYRDIDQFFNAASYWRSTDRYAPHNVYTNFSRLDALNKKKGYATSSFTGFKRADSEAVETPDVTKINVTISSQLFNSSYTYNQKTNSYDRSQAGAKHMDREDGQLSPKVLIVMRVATNGYKVTTSGSGNAYIFQNGTIIKGKWSKKSRASQLVFTDSSGKEVELARGQTWIAAVSNTYGNVSWQ